MSAEQAQQMIHTTGNATALAALTGWFVGVLPIIATLFTVIWFGILITEKVTGKQFAEIVRCVVTKLRSMSSRC